MSQRFFRCRLCGLPHDEGTLTANHDDVGDGAPTLVSDRASLRVDADTGEKVQQFMRPERKQ